MFVQRSFFAGFAVGAVMSCSEAPTTPPQGGVRATPNLERAVLFDDAQAAAKTLAELLAVNLGDPRVRAAIRNGLRASPYAEHRLQVAEFVRSAHGGPVAEAIESKAAERGYQGVATLLGAMGDWDIYVHREVKRREWRGGTDVLVGVGWEGIDQVFAFDSDGNRADFDPRIGWPSQTVVLLIPGEVMIPRVSPQPDTPGDVIQESFDGTFAAGFIIQGESGRTTVVPYDDVVQFGGGILNMDACPPEENTCPSGGGGGGNPWGFGSEVEGVSRLTLMSYHNVCDNPPLCNNLELQTKVDWPFTTDLYTSVVFSAPSRGCNPAPPGTNFPCEFFSWPLNVVIHPRHIPSISGSEVKLAEFLELDSPGFPAFNPHDVWCSVPHSWGWNSQQILSPYGMRSDGFCFPSSVSNVIISGSWTMDDPF